MHLKSNLAVYINNQLQTTVGQKAMVELRSRVMGLKVRYTTKSSGISFATKLPDWIMCAEVAVAFFLSYRYYKL